MERWFHVGCGESVAYRQGRCRHGAPRSHRAEEDAFEAGVGGQAGVERRVGRRDPGATGPELDERDAALGHQRLDEAIGIRHDALGDLLARQVAEVVEDGGQLVGVARPAVRRRLLQLGLDPGDDLRPQRPRRDAPRLAHRDGVGAPLLGVAGVEIRPVPGQQQRVDERRGHRRVHVPRPHFAVVQPLQDALEPRDVVGVVEALAQRLGHHGKVGLALHGFEQRVGFQPLQVGRGALAARHARDEQRAHRRVPEARAEERGADQRIAEQRVELLGRHQRHEPLGVRGDLTGGER